MQELVQSVLKPNSHRVLPAPYRPRRRQRTLNFSVDEIQLFRTVKNTTEGTPPRGNYQGVICEAEKNAILLIYRSRAREASGSAC